MDQILRTALVLVLAGCSIPVHSTSHDDGGQPVNPCLDAVPDCCWDPVDEHGRSEWFVLCSGNVPSEVYSEPVFCPYDTHNPRLNGGLDPTVPCALVQP